MTLSTLRITLKRYSINIYNPLKVLFVTLHSSLYGANKSLLTLLIGLKNKGVSTYVITSSVGPLTEELDSIGIDYCILNIQPWHIFRWKSKNKLNQLYWDIFQLSTGVTRFLKNILIAYKVKNELNNRKLNAVYSNSILTPFGLILSKLLKTPHIWHIREFGKEDYSLNPDFPTIFKSCLKKNFAITISKAIAQHHELDHLKNHKTVYNGIVPRSRKTPKTAPPIQLVFAMIGLLHSSKNQIEALNAMKIVIRENEDVLLNIYGDGDQKTLIDYIEENGLENNVFLRGYVKNVSEIIREAFAVLVCSHYEGFGRVTIEAMAQGTPVIGYNGPATNELIENRKNGLLYDNGPEDLADKMKQLMVSPGLYSSLSKNGILHAKNFTIHRYVDEIHQILKTFKPSKSHNNGNT